jgi:hypothetical protein
MGDLGFNSAHDLVQKISFFFEKRCRKGGWYLLVEEYSGEIFYLSKDLAHGVLVFL